MNNTDQGLLRRLAQGEDHEAYGILLNRHADMVYSTCYRILRDSAEAADVTQETFFQLFKAAERISGSAGGWLHQVATRRCVDVVRQNASRRRRENLYAQDVDPAGAGGSSWAEVSPLVDQAIERLPEQERELLIKHFLERKSMTQLAIETGLSQPTVSRRVAQGLELVRTHLRAQGVSLGIVPLQTLLFNSALNAPPGVLEGLGKVAIAGAVTNSASAAASAGVATVAIGKVTVGFATAGALAAIAIAVFQPSTDFAPTAPLPRLPARQVAASTVAPQDQGAVAVAPIVTAEAAPSAPAVAAVSAPPVELPKPKYLLLYRTNAPAVAKGSARPADLPRQSPAPAAQVSIPLPPTSGQVNGNDYDPEIYNEYMQIYRPMLMQAQLLSTSIPPTTVTDPARRRLPSPAMPNSGVTPYSANQPFSRSFTLGPSAQSQPPAPSRSRASR